MTPTPKHRLNEVVHIIDNLTDETAVATITEITISNCGVAYKAKIGFEEQIIYDDDEYKFENDCNACYSIIGIVGFIDNNEEE